MKLLLLKIAELIGGYNEVNQEKSLKLEMLKSAKENLKNYEKLLATLKYSNLEDKEIRIKQCEQCIRKQKQIISNLQFW